MPYLMRFEALAGTVTTGELPPRGSYLRAYDPEAHGGRGLADWTTDPTKALRFENVGELLQCWQRQSSVRPTRPDGRPNRPLTAYTVSTEEVP